MLQSIETKEENKNPFYWIHDHRWNLRLHTCLRQSVCCTLSQYFQQIFFIDVTLKECRSLSAEDISNRLGLQNTEHSDVFVICHRGNDSQRAVLLLREKLVDIKFRDIIGGYEQWALKINDMFPLY